MWVIGLKFPFFIIFWVEELTLLFGQNISIVYSKCSFVVKVAMDCNKLLTFFFTVSMADYGYVYGRFKAVREAEMSLGLCDSAQRQLKHWYHYQDCFSPKAKTQHSRHCEGKRKKRQTALCPSWNQDKTIWQIVTLGPRFGW